MLFLHASHLAAVFIKQVLRNQAVADLLWVSNNISARIIFGGLVVVAADKNAQVVHVCELIWRYERIRSSGLTSPCSSTRTMDEELHFRWKIEMDDVLKEWDIDTARSQISHYQNVDVLLSETNQPIFSCPLIHGTVYVYALKA